MKKMKYGKDHSKMCTFFTFLMSQITHPYIL